jgi:hypothetical protein
MAVRRRNKEFLWDFFVRHSTAAALALSDSKPALAGHGSLCGAGEFVGA